MASAASSPLWLNTVVLCLHDFITNHPHNCLIQPSIPLPTPKIQAPLWSLVALGAYALGNIGWNLMRFNSCPEAAEELQQVGHVSCVRGMGRGWCLSA